MTCMLKTKTKPNLYSYTGSELKQYVRFKILNGSKKHITAKLSNNNSSDSGKTGFIKIKRHVRHVLTFSQKLSSVLEWIFLFLSPRIAWLPMNPSGWFLGKHLNALHSFQPIPPGRAKEACLLCHLKKKTCLLDFFLLRMGDLWNNEESEIPNSLSLNQLDKWGLQTEPWWLSQLQTSEAIMQRIGWTKLCPWFYPKANPIIIMPQSMQAIG